MTYCINLTCAMDPVEVDVSFFPEFLSSSENYKSKKIE